MQPVFVPRFQPLPNDPDVIVIGAGAAGIAAGRRCVEAGLAVAILEARERVGGRAVTVSVRGHPIDLGAHWLHGGFRNPLTALAKERGEALRPVGQRERLLFVGRRRATPEERRGYGEAWDRATESYDRFSGPDRSFGDVLPQLGPWRSAIESTEVLLAGRPLEEVSFLDQPPDDLYADNHFIAGGYGAYLARLADGLPVRTECAAFSVDWSGSGVAVETAQGTIRARAVVVAVPTGVLADNRPVFRPRLPEEVADATASFRVGTYEHVLLHWPQAPFREPDRFVSLVNPRVGAVGLFSRIDGTDLHYMELNHHMAEAARQDGAPALAMSLLADAFSGAELTDCVPVLATAWRDDALSLGGWGVLPPGAKGAREILMRPVAERIWFAGEALAGPQIGTAGGAWSHGVRAAAKVSRLFGRG